MNPQRYQRVMQIIDRVIDQPERLEEILAEACNGDESLRREVDRLLAEQTAAVGFLEESPLNSLTDASSMIDKRVGPYRVTEDIGRGGMGAVYKAVRDDDAYKTEVAIKLIKRGMDTDYILRRFRNERQILANLNHPNIARLLDGGTTEDGLPYFVMEYIDGQPIDEYCDEKKLTISERLTMFRTVCAALQYAHQNLVIHRDLKPSNILVTTDGTLKLLDFGIAKLLHSDENDQPTALTITELRAMTPEYASPEQVTGDPITTASDVYSLGVVLYELLSGHRPYRLKRKRPDEIVRVICDQEPEKLSTVISRDEASDTNGKKRNTTESISLVREGSPDKLRRRLVGDLDNIVLKALKKDSARRYGSVEQLSEDIRRHLNGLPVSARRDTIAYRTQKFIQRNKFPVATATVLVTLLIGAVIVTSLQRKRAEQLRVRAETGEEKNRHLLYAAQMSLAYQAWDTPNVGRVLELLEAQRPQPDAEDLRGFEWYLLWRLTNGRSRVLQGSTDRVDSVVFSPDGTKLAAGSWDGKARIWDAASGQVLKSLNPHAGQIFGVAYSPDGEYLAAGSGSGLTYLWKAETGELARTMKGHTNSVRDVAFSPDGQILASASLDGTARLWRVDTAHEIAILKGHTDAVECIAFTPDGKMLATASRDHTAKLWDSSGRETATLKGHSWWLLTLAFSPDGKTLATSGSDGEIKLWDVMRHREKAIIPSDTVTVEDLSFSPDGKSLAVARGDSTVKLYDINTLKPYDLLRGHSHAEDSVAFSRDGKTLASGGVDGTVRLWDLTQQPGALTLEGHKDWVWNIAFSPDGRTLATAGKDASVKLWDVSSGREMANLSHPQWINSIAFSPDGSHLLTGSDDKVVRLWDVNSGQTIRSWSAQKQNVECVGFSPDGKLIAVGGNKAELALWNTQTGAEIAHLYPPDQNMVWSVAFSPNGKYLAASEGGKREAGTEKQRVTVWDVNSHRLAGTLTGHTYDIRTVLFSPDGKVLITGSEDGTIRFWDAATYQQLAKLNTDKVATLAISSDGKRIVTGSDAKTVKIWDVATKQELCTLTIPSEVTSVAFSPDNRVLAVASKDNKVRLWFAGSDAAN
jgi:WD40 repeat protein/serine/threonine protein kinase